MAYGGSNGHVIVTERSNCQTRDPIRLERNNSKTAGDAI